MKTYTLVFSHILNGQRVPLMDGDKEATLMVEAPDKTSAIYYEKTKEFCDEHVCSVRRVT